MRTHALLLLIGILAAAQARAGEDARPLIVLRISEEALNRAFEEPFVRESAVDDVILNARVAGTQRTEGRPYVALVDNSEGATFKATFKGSSVARTAGNHPPVVIYSRSRTDFTAEKTIAIEQLGNVLALPTKVEAKTQTTTEDIGTRRRGLLRRIVLRRAWIAVDGLSAEINAAAQKNAERRIVAAFDAALEARLARLEKLMAYRNFVAIILPPNSTPTYRSQTKAGYLTLAVFARDPGEKKVDIELPQLTFAEQPIQIWLHQSLVGQSIEATLATLDAARRLLGIPVVVVASDPSQRQRGEYWTLVDEWFVVQLSGTQK